MDFFPAEREPIHNHRIRIYIVPLRTTSHRTVALKTILLGQPARTRTAARHSGRSQKIKRRERSEGGSTAMVLLQTNTAQKCDVHGTGEDVST